MGEDKENLWPAVSPHLCYPSQTSWQQNWLAVTGLAEKAGEAGATVSSHQGRRVGYVGLGRLPSPRAGSRLITASPDACSSTSHRRGRPPACLRRHGHSQELALRRVPRRQIHIGAEAQHGVHVVSEASLAGWPVR